MSRNLSYWLHDSSPTPPRVLFRMRAGIEERWTSVTGWRESDLLLGDLLDGSASWTGLTVSEARRLFPAAFPA